MLKLKIKKTLLVSFSMCFIFGNTALASDLSSSLHIPTKANECTNSKCQKNHKNFKNRKNHFLHSAKAILNNKYDVSNEEINKAKQEGKTVFDIAKSKGLSEDKFRAMIIAPKLKEIDEMVSTGEISKEKANAIKAKLNEKIKNWDGKIEIVNLDNLFKNKTEKKDNSQ